MALANWQIKKLTDDELTQYEGLDKEDQASFEYFYGFTAITGDDYVVTNKEILEYQKAANAIQMKTIAKMLDFIPHKGQQPFFYTFDMQRDVYNSYVLLFGRRTGKAKWCQ